MTGKPQGEGEERGPKGGMEHQPGRGHDRKSRLEKKKRFAKRAVRKRREQEEEAERKWAEWDALPDGVKRLLGPAGAPKLPRPGGEE